MGGNILKLRSEELREEGYAEGQREGRIEGIAEGRAEGIAEGREEGKAEGLKEGKKIIALRMCTGQGWDCRRSRIWWTCRSRT